jgi:hypothetical protein
MKQHRCALCGTAILDNQTVLVGLGKVLDTYQCYRVWCSKNGILRLDRDGEPARRGWWDKLFNASIPPASVASSDDEPEEPFVPTLTFDQRLTEEDREVLRGMRIKA